VIFNDGAFDKYTKKDTRKESTVEMRHGEPLVFGETDDKGIILDGYQPKVVSIANGKYSKSDLLVHNENDSTLAFILANMTYNPELPRPMGVFQAIERPTYSEKVELQLEHHKNDPGAYDLERLMKGEDFWEIK
jgi:2-oxoglutarate ferredoxin oxidoreductase subunit beta